MQRKAESQSPSQPDGAVPAAILTPPPLCLRPGLPYKPLMPPTAQSHESHLTAIKLRLQIEIAAMCELQMPCGANV